jgi:hypothetical protein
LLAPDVPTETVPKQFVVGVLHQENQGQGQIGPDKNQNRR